MGVYGDLQMMKAMVIAGNEPNYMPSSRDQVKRAKGSDTPQI